MWVTAFIMGLAGSLHCAGMCSPLAMAITRLSRPVLLTKLLYNSGRIMTYGMLGAVAGLVGGVLDLSVMQRFFSGALGAGLVLMGIAGIPSVRIPVLTPLLVKATGKLKLLFGDLLKRKSRTTTLLLGFLNGLLPCGLTYMALSVSLTADGPANGFIYMVCFGIGTLPAMLGISWLLFQLTARFKVSVRKVSTVMFIALGVLLMARNFVHHQHTGATDRLRDEPVICR